MIKDFLEKWGNPLLFFLLKMDLFNFIFNGKIRLIEPDKEGNWIVL